MATFSLLSCGGDGSGSGSGSSPGPIATDSPSPSPSPSASPSPSPSPDSTSRGPLVGGAVALEAFYGPAACAFGTATFRPSGDPAPGLASFVIGNAPKLRATILEATGVDSYRLDPDYWGSGDTGTSFLPANKIASAVEGFDRFLLASPAPEELSVARSAAQEAVWGTFGTRATANELCVFGLTLSREMPPLSGDADFVGNVDGFMANGAVTHRLYDSRATFRFAKATGTGAITMDLRIATSPFGNYRAAAQSALTTLHATVTGPRNALVGTVRTTDGAWTGTISAQFEYPWNRTAAFAFELRHADGRRIWGASSLGDPACTGCWDY